jgi:hypothetical protein
MIINILSPLVGRFFTAYDYFEQIKRIIKLNPDITFNWVVNDGSKGELVKRMLDDVRIPYMYLNYCGGATGYEYKDVSNDLSEAVAETMNRMVGAMPPCDYALLIEDDIICKTENPIPYLLNGFTEGVGAVSACTFSKRLTAAFGTIQAMRGDGPKFKAIKYQDSGYTPVVGTAFGFIMFRADLLGKDPFMHNYGGHTKSVDISYGLKLRDLGYSVNYSWDIKIWHYFKTRDGIVDCAREANRKFHKEIKFVRKQLAHKNIVFVTVPDTMTDEEIKTKYKYDVKPEAPILNINYSI